MVGMREATPGRNKRATFGKLRRSRGTKVRTSQRSRQDLIRPCIAAGTKGGGIVLDPFMGSGTTAQVCIEEGRHYVGYEINYEYLPLALQRINAVQP